MAKLHNVLASILVLFVFFFTANNAYAQNSSLYIVNAGDNNVSVINASNYT